MIVYIFFSSPKYHQNHLISGLTKPDKVGNFFSSWFHWNHHVLAKSQSFNCPVSLCKSAFFHQGPEYTIEWAGILVIIWRFCFYWLTWPKAMWAFAITWHSSSVCRHRKLSHLNLLLWDPWTELNQTWQGWSLGGSLSKLCLPAPPKKGCV
jgi:hypothetical protein